MVRGEWNEHVIPLPLMYFLHNPNAHHWFVRNLNVIATVCIFRHLRRSKAVSKRRDTFINVWGKRVHPTLTPLEVTVLMTSPGIITKAQKCNISCWISDNFYYIPNNVFRPRQHLNCSKMPIKLYGVLVV